jgi:hypothetical protein
MSGAKNLRMRIAMNGGGEIVDAIDAFYSINIPHTTSGAACRIQGIRLGVNSRARITTG